MLLAHDLQVERGGTMVLHKISFSARPGELVALLGPNGAGKSTLLAVLSGALAPERGHVTLENLLLADWCPRALARKRAVLSQHSELAFSFRVLDVVLLGRSPYIGTSGSNADLSIARACLEETGVLHLADRIYTTLSGGERQRVQMARVLAQVDFSGAVGSDRYLLLDEPTSSLDLAHQHATLLTARRAAIRGSGVVVVLHDLNLAAMYADRIVLLRAGRVAATGAPRDALTEAIVQSVYGLQVRVVQHPARGCPHIIAV